MRLSRRTAPLVVVVALGLFALTPAAWSFFSSSGTGSASATVGTMSAPSNVSGSPSANSVSLTWTGPLAPGGGPVDGYYVQRSGAAPGGSCASSAASLLSASPTSCTDSGVASGTYTYTVVAVHRSWTASAASAPVSVAAVVVDHFDVTAPAGVTAGSAFSVSVTAKDASGTTATGYTGTVRFSSTDAQAVLPADYTFLAADSGTRTFANGAILKTAGSRSLTVHEVAAPAVAGSVAVTVAPGTASKLAFTSSNFDCSSGRARVGNGGTLTSRVSVLDAYGNAVAGSATRSVTLANNRSNAGLSPTSLSIASGASETSATFGQSIPIGSPPDHEVTASSSGLSPATCIVNKN